jgi:hypothetical protein
MFYLLQASLLKPLRLSVQHYNFDVLVLIACCANSATRSAVPLHLLAYLH